MINRIFNPDTNATIERPYSDEEITELNKNIAEALKFEAEQTAKAQAKASAMAKLAALGLNEEEVQAIVGA